MLLWKLLMLFYFIDALSANNNNTNEPNHLEEFIMIMTGSVPERYNCSGNTTEEWYSTGKQNTIWAVYYLLTGSIFFLISIPVLIVMTQPDLFKLPCYKIMFFIGCIESTEIWGVSLWPGWSAATGGVFCTNQIITTLVGKITMIQWIAGTSACVLLGINRLTDLHGRSKMSWVFDQPSRVVVLLCACLMYGTYASFFYDTVLFNSVYMAPLLNPMIGNNKFTYSHQLLSYHNTSVCVVMILVYFSLSVYWYYKRVGNPLNNELQTIVYAQSIMISLLYSMPAGLFVLIFYMPNPPFWLVHVSDISYQLSGGVPFIMYIIMNRKIRIRVFKLFWKSNNVEPVVPSILSKSTNP